jgi:hypothetical protein
MKIIISRSMHYSQFFGDISTNFQKWFGKSVVKTSEGNPQICYHGSPDDIKLFDPKFTGKGTDASGIGFYFTSDPSDADRYISGNDDRQKDGSGGNVMPVYLKIQKPIYFEKQPDCGSQRAIRIANGAGRKTVYDFLRDNYDIGTGRGQINKEAAKAEYFAAYDDMGIVDASFAIYNDIYEGSGNEHLFTAAFKAATKYDGIIRKQGSLTHYIVFNPTQIKSALGNNGKFGSRTPDLTK